MKESSFKGMDFEFALSNISVYMVNEYVRFYGELKDRILDEILNGLMWGVKGDKVVVECENGRALLRKVPDKVLMNVEFWFLSYSTIQRDSCTDVLLKEGYIYAESFSSNEVREIKDYLLANKSKMVDFDGVYEGRYDRRDLIVVEEF